MPANKEKPAASSLLKEREAKRWIIFGGTCATLGLVSSLAETNAVGAVLTILGLLASMAGLHRFGRLGRS